MEKEVFNILVAVGCSDEEIRAARLRAIVLVCPSRILQKAVDLADFPHAIRKIQVNPILSVFLVSSDQGQFRKRKFSSDSRGNYIVLPGRYCSCPFYQENVLLRKTEWTCKHDVAVRLRLAFGSAESMGIAPISRLMEELK